MIGLVIPAKAGIHVYFILEVIDHAEGAEKGYKGKGSHGGTEERRGRCIRREDAPRAQSRARFMT